MFAVLAEDKSDVESLCFIIKKLLNDDKATIKRKGFNGCGELCRKAGSHILNFADDGATHFIICHDSDRNQPNVIKEKVRIALAGKLARNLRYFIAVPVQELEAWIIADENAIRKVIPSLVLDSHPHPETIDDPKDWLIGKSKTKFSKPLYSPATHNPLVAKHLDLDKVAKKCPSFSELKAFVTNPPVLPQ